MMFSGKELKDIKLEHPFANHDESTRTHTSVGDLRSVLAAMASDPDPMAPMIGMMGICDRVSMDNLDFMATLLCSERSGIEPCVAYLVGSLPFKDKLPHRGVVISYLEERFGDAIHDAIVGLE
jgi:hypothetical protein